MTTQVISEHAVLTVDELRDVFEITEDIEERAFEFGEGINTHFVYDPEATNGKLRISFNGEEYPLSELAIIQSFDTAGVPERLAAAVPPELTLPILNWHFANRDGERKALIKDGKVAAYTKTATAIYSSVEILDSIVKAMRDLYNVDESNIVVDKVHHDIHETQYTLVFPDFSLQLDNGDVLNFGIQVQNSVLAKKPLVLTGYVGRDYHNNGMLSKELTAQWSRKSGKRASMDEVLEGTVDLLDLTDWIKNVVEDIVKQNDMEMKVVRKLTNYSMGNHSGSFLNDLFTREKVPVGLRSLVREELAEQDDTTVYALWNAISLVSNRDELEGSPTKIRLMMNVAGALARHPESCPSCHRLRDELD